jgi:hypothetical protein
MLTMAKDFRIAVLVCMVLSILGRMGPRRNSLVRAANQPGVPPTGASGYPGHHYSFRKMPTTFPTIWKLFSLFFTWIGAIAGFSG